MEGRRAVLALALGLLLAAMLHTPGGGASPTGRVYGRMSCSPYNAGPGGTMLLVSDLRARYRVIVSESVDDAYTGGLYMVIGPDTPFTREESDTLASLVRRGTINLLVADETPNSIPLLEALGLPALDGVVVNESGRGSWQYVVHMVCGQYTVPSAMSVRVPAGNGASVVCTYLDDGSPAAVLYRVGEGLVLVVGDSSIFANYLYLGYDGLAPTRSVALDLVALAADGKGTVIIDNSHYKYTPTSTASARLLASGVFSSIVEALRSASRAVSDARPQWALLAFLAAVLPWPAILLHPSREPQPWEDPVDKIERVLLEIEASRLGLPTEASIEEILEKAGVEG